MSVKIMNVVGMGYIIGEVEMDQYDHTLLSNVGRLVIQPDGKVFITEALPRIFADAEGMVANMVILKEHIIIDGDPAPSMIGAYEQYCQNVRANRAGIKLIQPGNVKLN